MNVIPDVWGEGLALEENWLVNRYIGNWFNKAYFFKGSVASLVFSLVVLLLVFNMYHVFDLI